MCELSLTLDSKTWGSFLAMLECFSEVKFFTKSFIDLNLNITFTENDLMLLPDTIFAMQLIKIPVETLCSKNINLYVADITFGFRSDKLSKQNVFLSTELKQELTLHVKERHIIYAEILHYLNKLVKLNTGGEFIINTH
jgi:hypothetical protein